MAGDLIREVRQAAVVHLGNEAPLTALVPAASIFGGTTPANVPWPFIRLDAFNSTSVDGNCYVGAEVSFLGHAFAKPRYQAKALIETAEDHASRIGSAMKEGFHLRRVPLGAASIRFLVRSSRLIRDGDEQDAWHNVLAVEARVLAV